MTYLRGIMRRIGCLFGQHAWASITPNVEATSRDGVQVLVFAVCTCRAWAMGVLRRGGAE